MTPLLALATVIVAAISGFFYGPFSNEVVVYSYNQIAPAVNHLFIGAPASQTLKTAPRVTIDISELLPSRLRPTPTTDRIIEEDPTVNVESLPEATATIPASLAEPTCGLTPQFYVDGDNAGLFCISHLSIEHFHFLLITLKEKLSCHILQPASQIIASFSTTLKDAATYFIVSPISACWSLLLAILDSHVQRCKQAMTMLSDSPISHFFDMVHDCTPCFVRRTLSDLADALAELWFQEDFKPLVLVAFRTLRFPFEPENLSITLPILLVCFYIAACRLIKEDDARRQALLERFRRDARRLAKEDVQGQLRSAYREVRCRTVGMEDHHYAAVVEFHATMKKSVDILCRDPTKEINAFEDIPDVHHLLSRPRLLQFLSHKPLYFELLANTLLWPSCRLIGSAWEGFGKFCEVTTGLGVGIFLPWSVKTMSVVAASLLALLVAVAGPFVTLYSWGLFYVILVSINLAILLAGTLKNMCTGNLGPIRAILADAAKAVTPEMYPPQQATQPMPAQSADSQRIAEFERQLMEMKRQLEEKTQSQQSIKPEPSKAVTLEVPLSLLKPKKKLGEVKMVQLTEFEHYELEKCHRQFYGMKAENATLLRLLGMDPKLPSVSEVKEYRAKIEERLRNGGTVTREAAARIEPGPKDRRGVPLKPVPAALAEEVVFAEGDLAAKPIKVSQWKNFGRNMKKN